MDFTLGLSVALRASSMGVGYALALSLLGICNGTWWVTTFGIISSVLRVINGRNLVGCIAAGAQLLQLRELLALMSSTTMSWELLCQAPCMTLFLVAGTIHVFRDQKLVLLKATSCWPVLLLLAHLVDSKPLFVVAGLCSPAVVLPIVITTGTILTVKPEEITGVVVVSLLASTGNFPQAIILLLLLVDISWISHQLDIRKQPPKSCLAASQPPTNVKVTFNVNTDFTASKHKIGPPRKKPSAKRPHLAGFNKAVPGMGRHTSLGVHHLNRLY